MTLSATSCKVRSCGGPWASHHLPSLAIGACAILGLSAVLLSTAGWKKIFAGTDGRVSTSKTITVLWTFVVAWSVGTVLVSVIARAGLPGHTLASDFGDKLKPLSDTYLLLLGGPFAALVLAKGITVSRIGNGTLLKTTSDGGLNPADLVKDDSGSADLVDFQFCLFNFIALIFVIVAFAWHPDQGLPVVPAALGGLTSASALAFTANKAFVTNAPVVTTVTVDPAQGGNCQLHIIGSNLGGPTVSTVSWDGNAVNNVTSGTSGSLNGQLTVAEATAGSHTLLVSVSDGLTTLETSKQVAI
jgi:hypothetical protein